MSENLAPPIFILDSDDIVVLQDSQAAASWIEPQDMASIEVFDSRGRELEVIVEPRKLLFGLIAAPKVVGVAPTPRSDPAKLHACLAAWLLRNKGGDKEHLEKLSLKVLVSRFSPSQKR